MKNQKLLKIAALSILTITFSCREEMITDSNSATENIISVSEGTAKNGRFISQTKNHYKILMIN